MGRISALRDHTRRLAVTLATLPVRTAARACATLRDDATRPAILYLVALVLAVFSFGSFLLGGGGEPTRAEFCLQLGSFGVLFYMSLRQAGTGGRIR